MSYNGDRRDSSAPTPSQSKPTLPSLASAISTSSISTNASLAHASRESASIRSFGHAFPDLPVAAYHPTLPSLSQVLNSEPAPGYAPHLDSHPGSYTSPVSGYAPYGAGHIPQHSHSAYTGLPPLVPSANRTHPSLYTPQSASPPPHGSTPSNGHLSAYGAPSSPSHSVPPAPRTASPPYNPSLQPLASSPAYPSASHASPPSSPSQSRQYTCPEVDCTASFSRPHDFRRHLNSVHIRDESTAPRCAKCNRVFSRADALKRHEDRGCQA